MNSKIRLATAFCLAAAIFVTSAPLSAQEEEKTPESLVGKVAPAVKLKTVDGKDFDLSALKGKQYVVLDFWATWCPWCRESTEDFLKLSKQYAQEDIKFYIVSVGEKAETIKAYAEEHNIKADFVLDSDIELAKGYAVDYIPHMVLIGKDGVVKTVGVGADQAHKEIGEALAEIFPPKPNSVPES